jgi:dTDP-4-amino-4,6-dideoxygalactose transaminase
VKATNGKAGSLAILGGTPAFREPLHVGRPNLGDRARLMQRVEGILDRNWLTNRGPEVLEFERRLAQMLGVRHCVAMSNATAGLEIALRASGLTGQVILPSYTFIATAHVLRWQGLSPVFCDIDPRTHNIDPAEIERRITPKTSAILGVHLWGRPCDIEALGAIAARHGLKLFFDAAHAFGCSYRGRMIGRFGVAEVFSFHATKVLNTFEGGAVATDDDALAERMRLMQNFGFRGFDDVVTLGTNAKMCEVAAAMGLVGLESLGAVIARNRENHRCYRMLLDGLPGVTILDYDERESNNYQYVVAEIDEGRLGLSRDELIAVLHAENVLARRYFWPGCHRMMPYRESSPEEGEMLGNTEAVAGRVVVLPTGTSINVPMIELVSSIVALAAEERVAVKRALRRQVAGENSSAADHVG